MKAPDDYDPVKAGYLEREIAQVNPLFALLQEASEHRAEFEESAAYRAEWFGRVDKALFDEVLGTMRADRRASE